MIPPTVTVIIPTYNRAEFLPLAIGGALAQSFRDFELLILDDASTDDTHATLLPFLYDTRIRYVRQAQNVGISANRNYGLSIAQGKYVAMLDSDDEWLDNRKLERQVALLDRKPECGVVGTDAAVIDSAGRQIGSIRSFAGDWTIRNSFFVKNPFVHSSVLIRKRALDAVGGYDSTIPIWEDYDLWLRIGEKFGLSNIPEKLTGYRKHSSNISHERRRDGVEAHRLILQRHGNKYPLAGILRFKIWLQSIRLN